MKDLRYGSINTTHFSLAKEDYLKSRAETDDPKVFAFVAEQEDTADDWDKLIMMAVDSGVNIIIIDINHIEENRIDILKHLLVESYFDYDLKSYEDRLCYTCDFPEKTVRF